MYILTLRMRCGSFCTLALTLALTCSTDRAVDNCATEAPKHFSWLIDKHCPVQLHAENTATSQLDNRVRPCGKLKGFAVAYPSLHCSSCLGVVHILGLQSGQNNKSNSKTKSRPKAAKPWVKWSKSKNQNKTTKDKKPKAGGRGHRSHCLSHAKRSLYHLS